MESYVFDKLINFVYFLEEENEFGDTAKYVTLDVAVGVE